MRFPSLQNIAEGTSRVIRRYPLECIAALTGTLAFVRITERIGGGHHPVLAHILLTCLLALPSLLAITLRGRYRKLPSQRIALEYGLVLAVLAGFFFSLQKDIAERDMMRFALLNVAAHLLVACAGFIGRGSVGAFWHFNKTLFLRMIVALLFSSVLHAGLAGALAAIDALFSFKVEGQTYVQLGIVIYGIFNTFFFLEGVPPNAEKLEHEQEYPQVLKVFSQYVLVPLVTVYLCILLAYEAKILIQWRLPKGWVSNLVIGYGIAGILSILLVHPIKSKEGNSWIKIFAKWFYLLLIPLVALMLVAISVRVNAYGFTIERAIVLASALWLLAMAIFFLVKPKGDIRVIPFSLSIVSLLVLLVGFPLAKQSQRKELKQLLTTNKLLVADKINAASSDTQVTFEGRKRITSIIQYLLQYHGDNSITPWLHIPNNNNGGGGAYNNAMEIVEKQLGLKPVNNYEVIEEEAKTWYSFEGKGNIEQSGKATLLYLSRNNAEQQNSGMHFRVADKDLILYENDKAIARPLQPYKLLQDLVAKHKANDKQTYQISISDMKQVLKNDSITITVYYRTLMGDEASSVNYEGIGIVERK